MGASEGGETVWISPRASSESLMRRTGGVCASFPFNLHPVEQADHSTVPESCEILPGRGFQIPPRTKVPCGLRQSACLLPKNKHQQTSDHGLTARCVVSVCNVGSDAK